MTVGTSVEARVSNRPRQRQRWSPRGPTRVPAAQGAQILEDRVRHRANLAVAVVAIVLTAPLTVAIAFAVKLTSPGPIFYRQTRVGLDRRRLRTPDEMASRRMADIGGVPFEIYKFRTMYVDAERTTGIAWASQDDPRVTAVGRWLRHTRLDELPQLFNVFRGDMNIVGPRPERPSIFANLRTEIASYQERQRARPGITGLAQISQSYDTCVDDVRRKVQHDLQYVERTCILTDLLIMVKTIPVVLFRKGAL